jgi:3-oxoacyl-[acyl-carrier-protein] synthase III
MFRIDHIEYHLPGKPVTSSELMEGADSTAIARTLSKTGVNTRFFASQGETALDLAAVACERLFEKARVNENEIDGVCFCSQTQDYTMPSNAFLLQERLGLKQDLLVFDLNHGCTGYIYSLALASGILGQDMAQKLLLVNADTYSKLINPRDRSTALLFGDGAAVSLVSKCSSSRIIDAVFRSDGKNGRSFMVPAGGQRNPSSGETKRETEDWNGNIRSQEQINMRGFEVWGVLNSMVPPMIEHLLERNKLEHSEIDLWIFHQSSRVTLDSLLKALAIPEQRVVSNIDRVGNTVSASIPILMKDAMADGKLLRGQKIILCGFGVGMSAGAILMEF